MSFAVLVFNRPPPHTHTHRSTSSSPHSVTRLDHEEIATHVLVVTATDGGVQPRSASVSVVINVGDVNEYAPVARLDPVPSSLSSSSQPRVWIPWNLEPGGVVARVVATDADLHNHSATAGGAGDFGDGTALAYTLVSPTGAAAFAARSDGAVVLRQGYTLTRGQEFNVTMVVHDAGTPPLSSEVTLLTWPSLYPLHYLRS